MKKLFAALFACALCLAAFTAVAQELAPGAEAPAFSLPDVNGKTFELTACKGKFVVLEWTNYECPFVIKHYKTGNMQALQKEFTAKDVVWLSICSSAPGKQGHLAKEEWLKRMEASKVAATAVLLDADGKVGRAYGARTTPHMFVIDPAGKIIYLGGIDNRPNAKHEDVEGAENFVRAALESALAGKPVATPAAKPYGCSVKY